MAGSSKVIERERNMSSPYDLVVQHFQLPFNLYPFQQEVVNELAPRQAAGYWMDTGTGKTATSTVAGLFKLIMGADVVIVTMPPILITGWNRWLCRIRPELKITLYRGTPKQRAEMKLDGQFILMSQQIFKRDYERLEREFRKKRIIMIVDEATSVKNVETDNYKMVRDFVAGHDVMLLSGTPLSTPIDAYAYTKLIAPGIYRNMRQFENVHVAERDFFGNVKEWQNLDLLAENMKVNAVRLLKTEVLQDLPSVTYDPIYYDLAPAHYKLYRQLVDEQILPLQNGGKIDATVEQALHHALQQIVCNWNYFADDPKLESAGFELVEEVLEELGGKKLVVFASYRMTNRTLVEKFSKKYGAVAAFGDLTVPQQQRNIAKFIDDPSIRLFVGQPTSMGVGVDGLQHVCSDALFLELPPVPKDFHQAVARLWRDGQTMPVNIRVAVAERTLQVRKLGQMLQKDALVSKVQRSYEDLRNALLGE